MYKCSFLFILVAEIMSKLYRSGFRKALKRKDTLVALFYCLLMTAFLHLVIKLQQAIDGNFKYLALPVSKNDLQTLEPLYPDTHETFPSNGELRIEKRIHQTWKTTQVSNGVIKWVKSWLKYNSDYEYWFWTDELARQLIKDKYPHFLSIFDSYSEGINRADAVRYIILYEYGGIYADLDMESLKSMDPILRKYSCILAQEPYEHPMLQRNYKNLAVNAFMACKSKHPFMKLAVNSLDEYSHMWNKVDVAGPHFLMAMYKRYSKYQPLEPTEGNGVYLTPPQYFMPVVDQHKFLEFYYICSYYETCSPLQKRACMHLKKYGASKRPYDISFAIHHWTRTYSPFSMPKKHRRDIRDIVPNVVMYPHVKGSKRL